jgi:hypothetical protein
MPKQKGARWRWVPPTKNTLQLKVTLKYVQPPIWRRLLAPDNITLGDLHGVIQLAMGWTNSHLHAFRIGSVEYGMAEMNEGIGLSTADEDTVLLRQLIKRKGQRFSYEYDFGDGWLHEVLVEKIEPAREPHPRVVCLAGKRACPPEDCGGVPGYAEVLRVLKKVGTEDDSSFRDGVGDYDPEHFDLDEVNRQLQPQTKSKSK